MAPMAYKGPHMNRSDLHHTGSELGAALHQGPQPSIASHTPMLPLLKRLSVWAAVVSLAACAAVPAPVEELAVAEAAVAHAAAAGAQELAPSEMGMARDKLNRAKLMVNAQDPQQARRLAQQAQLDALVAEAKAESAKARRAADEVSAASRALREEMGRKAP